MTISKEKTNLLLPLSFYSNLLFVIETLFISEQIAECIFGTFLEISDAFSSKLNVFSDDFAVLV